MKIVTSLFFVVFTFSIYLSDSRASRSADHKKPTIDPIKSPKPAELGFYYLEKKTVLTLL